MFHICCGHLTFYSDEEILVMDPPVHYPSHQFCLHRTVDRNSIISIIVRYKIKPDDIYCVGHIQTSCHAMQCISVKNSVVVDVSV